MLSRMGKNKLRLIIALLVGFASYFVPIPGLFGAALIFPEGVHSSHGFAYLILALVLNFALFFAATYYLFGLFSKSRNSN
jgi:hypothetical protein